MEITIEVGEVLFEFSSFENWVAKASSRYGQHGATKYNSITLDSVGRICCIGKQFMRARDEGAFPVYVYRLA